MFEIERSDRKEMNVEVREQFEVKSKKKKSWQL
jgi:hypothetical protein